MNRKQYNSDTRYAKVLEQMDLLGIMDVSTTRQDSFAKWQEFINKNHTFKRCKLEQLYQRYRQ